MPNGNTLRDELCDEFLGGDLKDRSLANVSDIVIDQRSLGELQRYVATRFSRFRPADFHMKVPLFPWRAIVSTNFDTIIEQAYAATVERVRDLEVSVRDDDKIDVRLGENSRAIPMYKVHGCIGQTHDLSVPLILSSEQYARYQKHRRHLFDRVSGLASQYTVVFCGYRIQDPNIQKLLFDLSDDETDRPRFFSIDPGITDYDVSYWGKHRFTCLKVTFAEFLSSLHSAVGSWKLKLPQVESQGKTSLRRFCRSNDSVESERLQSALARDFDHIFPGLSSHSCHPKEFYSGFDSGWGPIEQGLDAPRRVAETIVNDIFLVDEIGESGRKRVEVLLLKGPAGNGKSVAMRRIAWDGGVELEALCFYLKEGGALDFQVVQEIHDLTDRRVFLFIDRCALRAREVLDLIRRAQEASVRMTLVLAERDNEWNVYCEQIEAYVTEVYPVHYLSESEVEGLLDRLRQHSSLGVLAEKSRDEQRDAFLNRAQRQLLVALHEATLGKPFEAILLDEYERLVPDEAKRLYLDVCTLNRLGVPVRAGLIRRTGGITFPEFKTRFFRPLEHVVKFVSSRGDDDVHYMARHPHVAQVVFDQVLGTADERFEQIVRVLHAMNLSYSIDVHAFNQLTRARAVRKALDVPELGRAFFEHARKVAPDDVHLLHQFAIFEMKWNDLRCANALLADALEQSPKDRAILHSAANLRRLEAKVSKNDLERRRLRQDSRKFLARSRSGNPTPYDVHLSLVVRLDELEEQFREDAVESPRETVQIAVEIARDLADALSRFPDSSELLMVEHRLRRLTGEGELAGQALRNAFAADQSQEFVAVLLAKRLDREGKIGEAISVLESCLNQRSDAREARFLIGRLLIRSEGNSEIALQHLRRSFRRGDQNYNARLFTARELVLRGYSEEAGKIFDELRSAKLAPRKMSAVHFVVEDEDGQRRIFEGTVSGNPKPSYFFTRILSIQQDVFCHENDLVGETIAGIVQGDAVQLHLGVSMRGLVARRVWRAGSEGEG